MGKKILAFEELQAWQKARMLAGHIYRLTENPQLPTQIVAMATPGVFSPRVFLRRCPVLHEPHPRPLPASGEGSQGRGMTKAQCIKRQGEHNSVGSYENPQFARRSAAEVQSQLRVGNMARKNQ